MGNWIDNLQGGIQQVTDVVETIGDFGDAVSNAIDTVPSNNGVRDPIQVAYAAIQTKINQGQGLTQTDLNNMRLCEARGYSFSYPLESFSSGGSNSGIQTTGLLDTVMDTAVNTAAGAVTNAAAGGLTSLIPWWKGPGGRLQLPTSDPNIAEYLKKFSLDDSYLRVYYRAPHGYVVVRDAQGRPFAVLRPVARMFGLWRPAAKPPISATDWRHYKKNKQIEKKLIKIARPALRAHSRPAAVKSKRR